VSNRKLKVDFHLSDSQLPGSSQTQITNLDSSVQFLDIQTSYQPQGTLDGAPGSPQSIFAELQALRKKYDAVVAYTVHLTAERDYQFTQLEEIKKELGREKAKSKLNGAQEAKRDLNSSSTNSNSSGGGFSLSTILLISIVSYMAAKFIHSS
jgi:hypothetical protein